MTCQSCGFKLPSAGYPMLFCSVRVVLVGQSFKCDKFKPENNKPEN